MECILDEEQANQRQQWAEASNQQQEIQMTVISVSNSQGVGEDCGLKRDPWRNQIRYNRARKRRCEIIEGEEQWPHGSF